MKIEEEYNSIITKVPNWNTSNRLQILPNTIGMLLSNEPTTEDLLTNDLKIEQSTILELTLNDMKSETIKYMKRNKVREDTQEEILKEELQSLISEDKINTNIAAIEAKQHELDAHEEKKLFDILSKKKIFLMLDDERPTRRYLALESSKALKSPTKNQESKIQPRPCLRII